MATEQPISQQTLRSLFPLKLMTSEELELLSEQLSARKGKRGKKLVEIGGADNKSVYLLKGKVEIETVDGTTHIVEENTAKARNPLSCTSPHKCTITCLGSVDYFRIDNHIIDNLLERQNTQDVDTTADLVNEDLENHPLFQAIYSDIKQDNLAIPTLPKIAVSIRRAVEQDLPVRQIEILVQSDPALAAMLVKTANSALYRTRHPATTIEQAIMRLGLRVVKHLTTGYCLKNLFETQNKILKQRMKELWIHSAEVAAVCFVLARKLQRFDPEQALLLGLLHNVGELPILAYVEQYPDLVEDPATLEQTIDQIKPTVGSIILNKWQFPQEFVVAASESGNWFRDSDEPADYCDLILVAKLHTYIGRPNPQKQLPQLFEIPAFKKLGLDRENADNGLTILSHANEQITEVRKLLSL